MYSDDLISVIVPVYNCEKYVRQTLDSVVNQTYKNLEILVIDDGSTDNSAAICKEYLNDDRVKVFQRENSGVAASRQFGVDVCKGTYFVTLDSDDYVSLDFIEKLYKTIRENEADISVCGITCFDDGADGVYFSTFMPQMDGEKLIVTKEILASRFYQISCDLLLTDSWNKMYRTQFAKDTNVRYELPNIYRGSELQVNHRMAIHCPTYCVCREVLLFHRMREGSRVHQKGRPLQQGFEIITESLIKECESAGMSIKKQLSDIYYGMLGLVLFDHLIYGGNLREKHKKFKDMVLRNNNFLGKNKEHLDKYKCFDTFVLTHYKLPAFILSSALWLDVFSLVYCSLLRIKIRLGKKQP